MSPRKYKFNFVSFTFTWRTQLTQKLFQIITSDVEESTSIFGLCNYKQRQSTKYGFNESHYENEQDSYCSKLNISDLINLRTVVVLNSGIQNIISKKK